MADDRGGLRDAAVAAFERRSVAHRTLGEQAPALASASLAMARRFARGGKLLAFGVGGPTTDAQHISVEFVHPVIVGRRALPAVSLAADGASSLGLAGRPGTGPFAGQVAVLGNDVDIAVAVSHDGDDAAVVAGLQAARDRGLLTVALVGGDGGEVVRTGLADEVVCVGSDDPHVVKELHVCAYHVLWEMVHVFLDHPGLADDAPREAAPAGSVEALYPFLYDGAASLDALADEVRASTLDKVAESGRLRDEVSERFVDALVDAAVALAASFGAGGKLLTCGNGGSSSDAQEVAHDHLDPPAGMRPLPALCLTNDVAVVTALGNDVDFDVVFARQVRAFGVAGDVLLGLSTSGNSPNVLHAFDQARRLGMVTVGLAGGDGGAMAASSAIDHLVVVPSSSVHRIQEAQTSCYHVLRELVDLHLRATDRALPAPAPLSAPGPEPLPRPPGPG